MPWFLPHQIAPPLPRLQSVSTLFPTCHVSELTNPLPPLPPLQEVSPLFAMCHISELTNPSLPLPPLQEVSPRLQRATFPSSPTRLSHTFFPPASESLFCTMPCFQAHQPTPPSSSPPASESPFSNIPRSQPTKPLPPSSSPPTSLSSFFITSRS